MSSSCVNVENIDYSILPQEIKAKLALLELELSEGDITEKGFEKKRRFILAPYISKKITQSNDNNYASRKICHRHTRSEARYHSEVRQEAVQKALEDWRKQKTEKEKTDKQIQLSGIMRRPSARKTLNETNENDGSSTEEEKDQISQEIFEKTSQSAAPPLAVQEDTSTPSPSPMNDVRSSSIENPCTSSSNENNMYEKTANLAYNYENIFETIIPQSKNLPSNSIVDGINADNVPSSSKYRNDQQISSSSQDNQNTLISCSSCIESVEALTSNSTLNKQPYRTSILVVEDHPLPNMSASDDSQYGEFQPQDNGRMNFCTDNSSPAIRNNDKEDYANTHLSPTPRISEKIQNVIKHLQHKSSVDRKHSRQRSGEHKSSVHRKNSIRERLRHIPTPSSRRFIKPGKIVEINCPDEATHHEKSRRRSWSSRIPSFISLSPTPKNATVAPSDSDKLFYPPRLKRQNAIFESVQEDEQQSSLSLYKTSSCEIIVGDSSSSNSAPVFKFFSKIEQTPFTVKFSSGNLLLKKKLQTNRNKTASKSCFRYPRFDSSSKDVVNNNNVTIPNLPSFHQKIYIFDKCKYLTLGRNRLLKLRDLPYINEIFFSLKTYHSKKPRRKHLQEFFNDEDFDLEESSFKNSNAPVPSGQIITPAHGHFPTSSRQQDLPRSIDSILQLWALEQPKTAVAVQLDGTEKSETLTYVKLLNRASKIAFLLLTKQIVITTGGVKERVHFCLPGDRVALIYPNTQPLAFLSAFYGCIIAGLVPVPIEVPLTKRNAGMQQFGFLLGTCGVRVALTSEDCYKGLPKSTSAHSNSRISAGSRLPPSDSGLQRADNPLMPSSPSSTFNQSISTKSSGSGGSLGSKGSQQHNPINHFYNVPSGSSNDIANFKCWPKLNWIVTDDLPKISKDWTLPALIADDSCAYIEYVTHQDGVKGVCVSRKTLVSHSMAISSAVGYKKGDKVICLLDFKREAGLWHSVLAAVFSGATIYFVPYAVMKRNPSYWLQQVTRHRIDIAILRSRDLHWSLIAQQENIQLNLRSIRAIIVADGMNPWSLSSCDQFIKTFSPMGLNPNVICPSAGSSETGLVSLRRPPMPSQQESNGGTQLEYSSTGRGVLSMSALSYCVVRVDSESSLNSLTLQDTGQVIPAGLAVVVQIEGQPKLCRADEVGEICLYAPSVSSSYFGLKGLTQSTFSVIPLGLDGKQLGPIAYVRSGLIGFLGPEGLVFVVGTKQSMLHVSGRYHSSDDLIATVLAVEPMKFVYRGRIAIFGVTVLRDERIVIIAEQRLNINEEDSFGWMMRVVQAIDSIHHVGIYCIAFVPPNYLPKTALGGIHIFETKQRFVDGYLHPTTILMFPQNCILNLPKPREQPSDSVGPAAVFVGNLVQGARFSTAIGRELVVSNDECIYLMDILAQRCTDTPDRILYSFVTAGEQMEHLTVSQLQKRAERIGALLTDKGHLNPGDHVAIILPPSLELITAVFGCMAARLIPVCVCPPSVHQSFQTSMDTIKMIVDSSRSVALLSNSTMIKLLKSKEASHRVNTKAWPTLLDIEDAPSSSFLRKRREQSEAGKFCPQPSDICYLEFSSGFNGQLTGITTTMHGVATHCKSLKMACELYPSRSIAICLDPYSGLGFVLWCLLGVYAGNHSLLLSPYDVKQNPLTWLNILTQEAVRDAFCSYAIIERCVKELSHNFDQLKSKKVFDLSNLRNCIIVSEERPRVGLCKSFTKLLTPFGLNQRALSTSFGCRTTTICMQSISSPDLTTVYVDTRALRNDRISLVEKGSPRSIPLIESGKLLPGVKVVIADPKTKGQCADSHLGEIWVSCGHNPAGYYSVFGEETRLQTDHFSARLKTGDVKTVFSRTGFLGFLRSSQWNSNNELCDSLFILGSMEETLMLRGMRYYPCDIEATVNRAHRSICESALFIWTHLLVIVAETRAPETEALDLVPAITTAVLEEQQLIVGVVVIVDPGKIPVNSNGEKQRTNLRELFLRDQLDPIYVSYNM